MFGTNTLGAGQSPRNLPALLGLVALPLAVGGLSAFLTSDAMAQFGRLEQPPLSPPAWLFPVAWTILYVLMGIASYRLFSFVPADEGQRTIRTVALVLYLLQLAINFSWSLVFFGANAYWVAFGLLLAMWALIIAVMALASRIDRTATYLLVPYVAWTTFAAYLNLMIGILN
jgi:tryptophan-rich sensory protein